ncbi:MAG: hypothetical protein JWQ02_3341 [Capsulimonas sp.]|jgi:hypothetical protein|nr:hypothetical protein [Capsulimonas sp.]
MNGRAGTQIVSVRRCFTNVVFGNITVGGHSQAVGVLKKERRAI